MDAMGDAELCVGVGALFVDGGGVCLVVSLLELNAEFGRVAGCVKVVGAHDAHDVDHPAKKLVPAMACRS